MKRTTDEILNRSWRVLGDNNYSPARREHMRRTIMRAYYDVRIQVSTEIISGRFHVCAN